MRKPIITGALLTALCADANPKAADLMWLKSLENAVCPSQQENAQRKIGF